MTTGAPEPKRRFLTPKRAIVLVLVLLLPVVGFIGYSALTLTWSYSEGERAGVLQKFSERGWLCKTYEGELAMSTLPGAAPVLWNFTVRDEAVVPAMNAAVGQHVALHYTEHRGVPSSCFGDTSYFVNRVTIRPQN